MAPRALAPRVAVKKGSQRDCQTERPFSRESSVASDGGGLADAAVRCVEDAEEGDVVVRGDEEGDVGEDVLDLAPVVEGLRADHAVGDFAVAEGQFELAGLAVGAEEDGEVLPLAAVGGFFPEHFVGDEVGLLVIAGHGDDADVFADATGGAEDFFAAAGVVPDEGVRGVEDGLGGAVVFLEADDLGIGEEFLELQDVGDFRAAPAVDGLVVIADDADVVGRADELLEEAHLEGVRVLELIDGDAGVDFPEVVADIGVLAEDLLGEEEEVVEVDGVLGAEFVLVGDGELGEEIILKIGDIDAFVFRLGDLGEDGLGFDLLVGAAFADEELFHDSDLIRIGRDGKILLVAQPVYTATKKADAEGVEGADGHLFGGVLGDHAADALLHLGGGLVGEGDGEDFRRRDFPLQHVGDAAGDGAGLPGAGAGQDHDRAIEIGDRLALGVVEGFECEVVCHERGD